MSEPALLQAILDRPDEDVVRLVYADAREEQGDLARAEFIRVQCQLARLPESHPDRRLLEDREHDLLDFHEATWIGLDDESSHGLIEVEFHRGFLEDVSAGVEGLSRHASDLLSRHPLRRWHFSRTGNDPVPDPTAVLAEEWTHRFEVLDLSAGHWPLGPLFENLTPDRHPRLREIDVSNTPGIGALADFLARSPITPRLTRLALGGRSGAAFRWGDAEHETLDPQRLSQALTRSAITNLALFDCGLTTAGVRALLSSGLAETVRILDIADNPIAPDAWRAFAHAPVGLHLESLDVSGTPLAGISLEPLLSAPGLRSLTRLEMNRCGSARRNMEVVAASPFWTQATHLRAHAGTIPASTLEPLAETAGPPSLQLLDLGSNYLRKEGVQLITEAAWSRSLTWLSLTDNYLDDDAVRVIADRQVFPHLRTLHLSHNNLARSEVEGEEITDHGLVELARSGALPSLRILTVSYTGISDVGAIAILDAPQWQLTGLGMAGCDLSRRTIEILATSRKLSRLSWLDLSGNPRLSGDALRPLLESPHLSRLCELDIAGIYVDEAIRVGLRERLGRRLSE